MKMGLKAGYLYWTCPAQNCGDHLVPIEGAHKWEWNGSLDRPTLTPSVKITWDGLVDGIKKHRCCHFHLVDGIVNFCGDCTHELSNKNVPLADYEN